MGLDMYLTKHIYIGAEYPHNKIEGNISITKKGKVIPINFSKVSYIVESAGYWRKANQIHEWFVKNVQEGADDCKSYYANTELLQELLETCKQVKTIIDNSDPKNKYNPNTLEQLAVLLPTKAGFFFGDTDYNDNYYQDVIDTIEILEPLINNEDSWICEYFYQASW